MVIQYLKGPMRGIKEKVVKEIEENGSPIYITDTGKRLSNNDLNKLFRFAVSSKPNIDLASLGDPSLIDKDIINTSNAKLSAQEKLDKENVQLDSVYLKKNKNSLNNIQKKPNLFLEQFFQSAKKQSTNIKLNLPIEIPTKEFYNLINKAINITDEEFIERVYSDINVIDLINDKIKKEIKEFYISNKKLITKSKVIKKEKIVKKEKIEKKENN